MATETKLSPAEALAALYGSDTFSISTMQKYLSKGAYKKIMLTIHEG